MGFSLETATRHLTTGVLLISGILGLILGGVSAVGGEIPLLNQLDDPHAIMLGAIGLLSIALGLERAVELRKHHKRIIDLSADIKATLPSIESRIAALQAHHTSDTALHCGSQETIYSAAAHALSGASKGTVIRHAHIKDDPAHGPPSGLPSLSIQAFVRAFENCISQSRPGEWEIRQFFAVTNLQRLNVLEARVRGYETARFYTVKIWPTKSPFPSISPLIVGEDEAFITLDDPSSPHISEGVYIRGRNSVSTVVRYFDSFYYSSTAAGTPVFTVRNEQGVQEEQFEKLRRFMIKSKFP